MLHGLVGSNTVNILTENIKKNIIIKSSQKLGSCANMAISPYSWSSGVAVVAVVVVAWEPMWW